MIRGGGRAYVSSNFSRISIKQGGGRKKIPLGFMTRALNKHGTPYQGPRGRIVYNSERKRKRKI